MHYKDESFGNVHDDPLFGQKNDDDYEKKQVIKSKIHTINVS